MKLVAAKCPNCGADIEVDKNSDSTVCDYCNSRIIVEDAIEKYNFEISGTVEVNNLPRFENYIRLGERYFNDKEYKDAYETYNKAVELNPDHPIAILRKGLCKAYSTNYNTFEINAAINGARNAYELLVIKGELETIEQVVEECNDTITFLDNLLFTEYNRNGLHRKDLENFNLKIQACLNGFEYLYGITKNKEFKKILLHNIIKEIDHLLLNKSCKTGFISNGVESRILGSVSSSQRAQLMQMKRQYITELNILEGKNIEQTSGNSLRSFMSDIVKDFKNLF